MNQISDSVLETAMVLGLGSLSVVVFGLCVVVRFLATGRALFERRVDEEPSKIHKAW